MEEEFAAARAGVEKKFALLELRKAKMIEGQACFDRWQTRLDSLPAKHPESPRTNWIIFLQAHGEEDINGNRQQHDMGCIMSYSIVGRSVIAKDSKGKLNFANYVQCGAKAGHAEVCRGHDFKDMMPPVEDSYAMYCMGVKIEIEPMEIESLLDKVPLAATRGIAADLRSAFSSYRFMSSSSSPWFVKDPDNLYPPGSCDQIQLLINPDQIKLAQIQESCVQQQFLYARIYAMISSFEPY